MWTPLRASFNCCLPLLGQGGRSASLFPFGTLNFALGNGGTRQPSLIPRTRQSKRSRFCSGPDFIQSDKKQSKPKRNDGGRPITGHRHGPLGVVVASLLLLVFPPTKRKRPGVALWCATSVSRFDKTSYRDIRSPFIVSYRRQLPSYELMNAGIF